MEKPRKTGMKCITRIKFLPLPLASRGQKENVSKWKSFQKDYFVTRLSGHPNEGEGPKRNNISATEMGGKPEKKTSPSTIQPNVNEEILVILIRLTNTFKD